ncbi:MAG: CopG family transcriptional regulator [Gemmatimonadaceae bacterium]
MTQRRKPPSGVREPVQVYLDHSDRDLLERAAEKSGLSKAEVLRRGLRRVGADLLGDDDPMFAFMREMADARWPTGTPSDIAREHDKHLASTFLDRHDKGKR